MKVIAQTAALQDALALAGSIVAARTTRPVLQCVKMVAQDNTLTLMTTDLDVGCRYQVTAVQVEEPGEALVPAERLSGIVREASDETLTLQSDKEACHIRGAGSRFRILGYDPGEYPAVADFTEDGDFQIPSAELSKMIGKTLFAAAKTHSHYAISGVLWEAAAKKLQLVATDGHRLAMCKGSLSGPAAKELSAIVPGKLMSLIQRIAGEADETLEVRIQENQILVRTARAVLVSTLVQGNFPKYADVIPRECSRKASLNTGELEHRVRQAALLVTEESRGVRLSFKGDQLTLSSRSPETGEAEVTCPASLDGEELDIAFNPQFLLDALKVAETDEVTFEMNASNKPAMMKAGNEFVYVLMPVDLG